MAAQRTVELIAHALLTVAARRWPADPAGELRAEWAAELATLRHRPRRMLAFAGSLAISDPPGVSTAARAASATSAALLVLLAAALFNGVRASLHSAETTLPWSGEATLVCVLLATALAAMAAAGARWAPRRPVRAVSLCGLFAYAFLLAGNETAIMPFMGWRDVTPAVAAWTAVLTLSTWSAARLRAAGRRVPAAAAAIGGGLLAVEAAAIAGSLHAAAALGLSPASAPLWFPLSMLPGGTGGFGPFLTNGHTALGHLPGAGPAFHASDILLTGAATLTGPLLLCTAFLTAALLRTTRPATPPLRPTRLTTAPLHTAGTARLTTALLRAAGTARRTTGHLRAPLWLRTDPRIGAGAGTAALVLLLAERLPRSSTVAELALPRVIDNSTVFGFGFLAHPSGRAALALAVALLVVHRVAARTPHPRR
jgi:hypothetical protein